MVAKKSGKLVTLIREYFGAGDAKLTMAEMKRDWSGVVNAQDKLDYANMLRAIGYEVTDYDALVAAAAPAS
jgi:hypothetical protein